MRPPSFGRDVKTLARKLIIGRDKYFSDDSFNSEGRKVFEELARMLVFEHPYYKKRVREVRRKGDFTTFIKLAEVILGEEEVKTLLSTTMNQPYDERRSSP
ncbi:hypothetical protein IG193_07150 [Infirmifilum lucidum]|uniref:Uncharacterized protein n=1 Tax=Infirmifilum lucidum TaxID=2776706 RepID=A0A7L9FID1_9CREN|nr:hypothetical protein [Infirmifilum lucidum]QOJ78525.1 hypothetical protein IG193_07150 [Infirmifilum lucidum]